MVDFFWWKRRTIVPPFPFPVENGFEVGVVVAEAPYVEVLPTRTTVHFTKHLRYFTGKRLRIRMTKTIVEELDH